MEHSQIITVFSYQTTGFNICVEKLRMFVIDLATVARISLRNLEKKRERRPEKKYQNFWLIKCGVVLIYPKLLKKYNFAFRDGVCLEY